MEIDPLEELKKYSKLFANYKKYIKKIFDKHHRSFGKFILIITILALLIIIFFYILENTLKTLHGEEISFEMAIVSLLILGILAYFYSTKQAIKSSDRILKAKFRTVSFCFLVFLVGTFIGTLLSKVGFTEYGVLEAEEKYRFFVDVLLVLLTFTAMVWYLLHRQVERDIKDGLETAYLQNRYFTEAQSFKNAGYMHYHIYKEHYEKYSENEDELRKSRGQLKKAINYTKMALFALKKTDTVENESLLCLIKNNLAYYLAIKWQFLKDTRSSINNNEEFKNYLSDEEKKDKYNRDKRIALEHLKYINKEERLQKYSPSLLTEIVDTCDEVKKIFEEIDSIINW